MARDPGSVWAPLPEAGVPDGMVKDAVIVHSTGDNGTAAATRRFFELAKTVTESTFIIGWGPEDPTLQIMDSTDIADANVSANGRAISIEVVGDGKGGYNAWQRSELIRVIRWCKATHPNIADRICRTATDAGLGWHVMFGAPGPWAAVAKICPGPLRIAELRNDIFPAVFAAAPAATPTPLQEDFVRIAVDPTNTCYILRELSVVGTGDIGEVNALGKLYGVPIVSATKAEIQKAIDSAARAAAALAATVAKAMPGPELDVDEEKFAAAVVAKLDGTPVSPLTEADIQRLLDDSEIDTVNLLASRLKSA